MIAFFSPVHKHKIDYSSDRTVGKNFNKFKPLSFHYSISTSVFLDNSSSFEMPSKMKSKKKKKKEINDQ